MTSYENIRYVQEQGVNWATILFKYHKCIIIQPKNYLLYIYMKIVFLKSTNWRLYQSKGSRYIIIQTHFLVSQLNN